eukprot:1931423-Prymnesium_polylepis.1
MADDGNNWRGCANGTMKVNVWPCGPGVTDTTPYLTKVWTRHTQTQKCVRSQVAFIGSDTHRTAQQEKCNMRRLARGNVLTRAQL